MSEKRFTLDSDFVKVTSQVAWDNQEEKGLTLMKLMDLLNRQQISIETMLENMEKLEKENKELGKNFDDIVKWASEIAKRNVVLDERVGRLQQENKELKKENALSYIDLEAYTGLEKEIKKLKEENASLEQRIRNKRSVQ